MTYRKQVASGPKLFSSSPGGELRGFGRVLGQLRRQGKDQDADSPKPVTIFGNIVKHSTSAVTCSKIFCVFTWFIARNRAWFENRCTSDVAALFSTSPSSCIVLSIVVRRVPGSTWQSKAKWEREIV
jgi:hypothetical protein